MRSGIKTKITHLKDCWTDRGSPADESSQPCGKLDEAEGLLQVVVRPRVQAVDAVGDPLSSRQHQHRRPAATSPDLATDLKPIELGKHDVKNDGVIGKLSCLPDRLTPVHGDVDAVPLLVPLLLEAALHQCRHPPVVFDNEHTHEDHDRDV